MELKSKRFVVRKSLIGKNAVITVEFKNGKIRSSFNIDFQTSEFIDNLKKLDKEKPYIIYCMSGNRSLKASHVMKSLGFKMIYHYKNGYKDWVKD